MKQKFTKYPQRYVKASTAHDYWTNLQNEIDTIVFNTMYEAIYDLDAKSVINEAFEQVGYPPSEEFPRVNTNINFRDILREDNYERSHAFYALSEAIAKQVVSEILEGNY